MPYHLLRQEPVPIWYVEKGHKPSIGDEPIFALYDSLQAVEGRNWITFRGVPINRLPAVLANGVDVEPTDTTIFCAEEDKAYEYARPAWGGDGPGLMYALHGGYLERSFQIVPADTAPAEIEELRKTYPHQYDGPRDHLYFSRLPGQVNTAYEYAYGYWVPKHSRAALLGVFLRGPIDEVMDAMLSMSAANQPSRPNGPAAAVDAGQGT